MAARAKFESDTLVGAAYALGAFAWWGLNPIYFKAVGAAPVFEVLAHRVLWSVLFLAPLIQLGRRWPHIASVLRDRRTLLLLAVTGVILVGNWSLYIWSVASAQLLQASLGYYVNPLISMLLGFAVLGERLRLGQCVAVALAGAGVLNLAISYGAFPWLALALALSFAVYGLLRKIVAADSLEGLFVETLLVSPFALGLAIWFSASGAGLFGNRSFGMDLLLALAGPVTAIPLLWFASGARRLRLAAVGFCQYINPTIQLLLGALLYHEPFTRAHLVTFALIWTAIALYSLEAVRAQRAAVAAI